MVTVWLHLNIPARGSLDFWIEKGAGMSRNGCWSGQAGLYWSLSNSQDASLNGKGSVYSPGHALAHAIFNKVVFQGIEGNAAGIGNGDGLDSGIHGSLKKPGKGIDEVVPEADIRSDHDINVVQVGRRDLVERFLGRGHGDLVDLGMKAQKWEDIRVRVDPGYQGLVVLGEVHPGQSPTATHVHDVQSVGQGAVMEVVHQEPTGCPDSKTMCGRGMQTFKTPDHLVSAAINMQTMAKDFAVGRSRQYAILFL